MTEYLWGDNQEESESDESIIFDVIVKPIIRKLNKTLLKLNIGILRILLIVAYLFLGWGVNKLLASAFILIAYNGIFTKDTLAIIMIVAVLLGLVSCPVMYLSLVLNKKAKQEIEQGNTDIYKKSSLNTVGKVGRIICSIIGAIVFIIGLILGIYIYGADSLILLNLTGCCFWLGADVFFGGLEDAFRTIEELSQDDDT